MPRLRRVNRLCSSMVSGTADRPGHGSTLCSPTVEKILCRSPISERSPVSGLRQAKKQRETGVKRVETAGVYPLAHRRGYGESSAVRRRQLSAEVQRKTFRPDRMNRLRGSSAPDRLCRKHPSAICKQITKKPPKTRFDGFSHYLSRLKRFLKRSTRPPVSTSFCLPVKKG